MTTWQTAMISPAVPRRSGWRRLRKRPNPLNSDTSAETVVVGGGIAGLTIATLLAEAGRSVALVERDRIGVGVTGHATAKVTTQHGLVYESLVENHSRETARRYAEANHEAMEFVAERIAEHDIDCGFERLPAYTFAEPEEDIGEIRNKVRAAQDISLPASFVEEVPAVDTPGAVKSVIGRAMLNSIYSV